MSSQVLVAARDLGRNFGAHWAVQGLSLEVNRGEVLGLLGPNGAGKSTTLALLTGTLPASTGRVLLDGIDVAEAPRRAKARVGFLPDHPPLYPELTVTEYLRYAARLRGVARRDVGTAVRRAVDQCGLTGTETRLVGNLSRGYQQRIGIAQALVHGPSVVVLDEPTVALDPRQIQEIRALIRALRTEHAVILSTHILAEVQHVCDRVLILAQGQAVCHQDLAELDGSRPAALRVRFDERVTLADLMGLPGIAAAHTQADGSLRLELDGREDPAPAVVRHAVDQGLTLRELTPERWSLEQLFLHYTSGEGTEAVA